MTIALALPAAWHERAVEVLLIGAGGTGSHLAGALMSLDHAVRSLGHPGGLHVTVYDSDRVTLHNIGRQAFWPADIGQNKALTLVQRANLALGLDWVAESREFRVDCTTVARFDLIITAVDRASVRAAIGRACREHSPGGVRPVLWLDAGNGDAEAQLVLGHWRADTDVAWVPNVYQLYPELEDLAREPPRAPSCSAAESLARQWLPINRLVADLAQALLWRLFREGRIDTHGAFIDLRTLSVRALATDPAVWASFGWAGPNTGREA